jgi:hypothetical protein
MTLFVKPACSVATPEPPARPDTIGSIISLWGSLAQGEMRFDLEGLITEPTKNLPPGLQQTGQPHRTDPTGNMLTVGVRAQNPVPLQPFSLDADAISR